MSKITICEGNIILTSKKDTIIHAFDGNITSNAQQKNIWKGEKGTVIGDYEVMELLQNGYSGLFNENIVIVGAEVHDKSVVNKLMFMAQAVRRVKISSVQTVLYFKHGYSKNMISEFNKSLTLYKKNIEIIPVSNLTEVINYINTGTTNALKDFRTKKDKNGNLFKVKNIYIYSHGMPSRITFMLDWDVYKTNNKISSNESAEGNELSFKNYSRLNPKSFAKDSELWSYACRTGLSVDNDTDVEKFTWGEKESLAQKLSDRLNIKVHAFLRRSNYSGTWGSKSDRIDLKVADNLEKVNLFTKKDDDFRAYKKKEKKIDGNYPWQPQGAYRDVIAGDSPYGPPGCMCIFQKDKDMIIPCDTMTFPKG